MLKRFTIFLLQFFLTLYLPFSAHAQGYSAHKPVLPIIGPLPIEKPLIQAYINQNIKNSDIDDIISNSILRVTIPEDSLYAASQNIASGNLKKGLDALNEDNIENAVKILNSMEENSLDLHILTWAIAISSSKNISSDVFLNALNILQDWPSTTIIRRNYERALAREEHPVPFILNAFKNKQPITVEGKVAYGEALIADNQVEKAQKIMGPWWQNAKLTSKDENLVLQKISASLTKKDHLKRMRTMLLAYRIDSAKRVASLANAQSLYNGFAAVARNEKNALSKLNATNKYFHKDPIYLFAKIQYYRRDGQFEKAAKLMLTAPKDKKSLINPDSWWIERRVLSRELLDINNPKLAYKLVANHYAESPSMAADAEFHAGWYALRFLNDPQTAFIHFSKIAQFSKLPISIARSNYWMGRALEAQQQKEIARQYYQIAAHYGTTYYGQLAQSKLKIATLEIPYPKPTEDERQKFSSREAVIAINRLQNVGYADLASALYRELGNTLKSPGELALLAVMAEKQNDHYTSLKIGKNAVLRGLDVGSLSHPLGAIPSSANISASGKALAYAIARQESEFKIDAISSAGAIGMLQLLPKTAKSVALKNSIAWSYKKLTSDVGYNVTLGAHFLGEQLDRFNGSYILTFIGYNAGPRRAHEWIARYGDPRGENIDDVVDWVERIPYTETRNYVMRVMENYEVYKARISGTTDIATDLVSGRRDN